MKKLRIISLLLALLMVGGILVGCSNGNEDDTDTGVATAGDNNSVETDEYGQVVVGDKVPYEELDYGGAEVYIACRPDDSYMREFGKESRSGTVDEKIYLRNKAVEDDLGVKIVTVPAGEMADVMGTKGTIANYVTIMHQSGDPLDIVAGAAAYAITPGARDCYVNLKDDSMKYLYLDQPYWNQSYIDATTVYGQLYYLTGDINLSVYDRTMVIYVNESLLPSNMSGDALRKLVLEGEWTFDVMKKMITDFGYEETDNLIGETAGDRYGLIAKYSSEAYDGFMPGFDINNLLEENNDGTWSFNINGNQKLIDALDKIKGLYASSAAFGGPKSESNSLTEVFESFRGSRALFMIELLYRNEANNTALHNAGFEWSILPMPKYNAEQEGYYTTPQDMYNTMSVMNHMPERLEMVSAVLDLLCSRSYSDVRPYYIEKIIKTRMSDNTDEFQIMEQILDGVVYETSVIYGQALDQPAYQAWRYCVMHDDTVGNRYATRVNTYTTKLDEWQSWFYARAN